MHRNRIAAGAAFAALATGVLGASSAGAANPTLTGIVNDAAKIELTAGGKKVTKLKAGAYTIVIKDTTAAHNFRLKGPGVNKATTVPEKKTVTWKVTLKKGKYTFVCDPHPSFMKGTFTVS